MFTGFAPTNEEPDREARSAPELQEVDRGLRLRQSFETRSTAASIHMDVCAQCHPFFTGKQRLVDTAGRVERFRQKYQTEPAAAAQGVSMEARLRQALQRAAEVERLLADPAVARDPAQLQSLGREHARLAPIVRLASG